MTPFHFELTIIRMKRFTRNLLLFVLILGIVVLGTILFIRNHSQNKDSYQDNEERLILGFSQIGSESAWRTRNTQSIIEAAAENNIQLIFDDAQQKQSNQLKAIRSFIVYQVDVIAFVPIVEDGWDNVLQEAKDAGIPVIIVDRQINTDPSLYAGFLGENAFKEGLNAAQFLVNRCKNINSEINIVEFYGTKNSSVATARANGFRNRISEDEKFNIIHSEDGDFLRSRGKEIMDRIILDNNGELKIGNKHIDVIYSHNDSMTLGILDSLDSFKVGKNRPIIISIDAEQKSIDALTEGKVDCIVECNPNLGPILMTLVKNIAAGRTIPRASYMEESVFTANDDFSTYQPRGY